MQQQMAETNSSNAQTNSSVSRKVRAVMAAISQQWPNAQIDSRDPTGVWSNAIDTLSDDQVRYGIRQLAHITNEFALNPAQFRAHALTMPEAPPKPAQRVTEGERGVVLKALNTAYAHRIFRKLGMGFPLAESPYTGSFDFMSIVNATPLPEADNHNHKWYWEQLWKNFNEAWKEAGRA